MTQYQYIPEDTDIEEVGMATCKYCRAVDQKSQMHKDRYTKEFYHEWCRPVQRVGSVSGEVV